MSDTIQNYLEKFSLRNKVAYVTGGLGLIGTEISIALASAGAKTIILNIREQDTGNELVKKIKHPGYDAQYIYIDITGLENIETEIENLSEIHGIPDIWVNNAYPRTSDWGEKVEDLKLDSWRENVDMHMNSYSWLSRKVFLLMRENGGDGIYAAWTLCSLEDSVDDIKYRLNKMGLSGRFNTEPGQCPVAEQIQPRLMQLTTNQKDEQEMQIQANALFKTIKTFQ